MNHITIVKALIAVSLICGGVNAEGVESANSMILHPERYIKITDWSFYVVWGGVPIIHHVTIENIGDVAYKNIKVRVRYYSTSYSKYGTQIGQEAGVLPLTLPPHSRETYLKGGFPIGAGSGQMFADNIEVLGAIPLD